MNFWIKAKYLTLYNHLPIWLAISTIPASNSQGVNGFCVLWLKIFTAYIGIRALCCWNCPITWLAAYFGQRGGLKKEVRDPSIFYPYNEMPIYRSMPIVGSLWFVWFMIIDHLYKAVFH